ncbi:MAG: hypothetical protein ACRC1K_19540 [Planctomycetia bacterium]
MLVVVVLERDDVLTRRLTKAAADLPLHVVGVQGMTSFVAALDVHPAAMAVLSLTACGESAAHLSATAAQRNAPVVLVGPPLESGVDQGFRSLGMTAVVPPTLSVDRWRALLQHTVRAAAERLASADGR